MRIATLVTQRDEEINRDTIGKTPPSQADVKAVVKPWYFMILIRVARVYLQSVLGLITTETLDLTNIDGTLNIFIVAAGPAFFSLLQNSYEILSKLDNNEKYVAFRG